MKIDDGPIVEPRAVDPWKILLEQPPNERVPGYDEILARLTQRRDAPRFGESDPDDFTPSWNG